MGTRHHSQRRPAAKRPRAKVLVPALFAGLLSLGAVFAWCGGHLGFVPYDDEGYVMISMRELLDGHPLYDEVYTQYGPFFYLSHAPFYSRYVAGLSHDVVRLETVVLWLLTAACAGLVSWRISGKSALAAATAFALALFALRAAVNEPGHPQGLCGLLVVLTLLATTFLAERRRTASLLLGVLVAALAMTKINLGVYVAVAVLWALISEARAIPIWRAALYALSAVILALPLLVMRDFLTSWSLPCALFVELAVVPAIVIVLASPVASQRERSQAGWFLLSAAMGIALVAAATLALGTSPHGLWQGLIGQHLGFARAFHIPPPGLTGPAVLLAVPGMAVGLAYAVANYPAAGVLRMLKLMFAALVIVTGLCWQRFELLLFFALPWSWLVLTNEPVTTTRGQSPPLSLARVTLGVLTPLFSLIAYPVAGSQVFYATLPLVICAAVCGADALGSFGEQSKPRWMCVATVGTIVAASVSLATFTAALAYQAGEPLDLPGAMQVRVAPGSAEVYRWLADRLRAQCDTFVSMPGFNSLYFWTDKAPPTSRNTNVWMTMLTDEEQAEIVALEKQSRVMAVRHRGLLDFWVPERTISTAPLVRYIDSMEVVASRDGYELLRRGSSTEGATEVVDVTRTDGSR